MKTMLYVDPSGDSDLVRELSKARVAVGVKVLPDLFMYLSMLWRNTLHGYELEFKYLLREVPAGLRDAPLTKVVIEDQVDFDPLMEDGLYEPSGVGVFAQVESYRKDGDKFHTLRIETTTPEDGAELLDLANDYYGKIRRHDVHPTTIWVQPPPNS